MPEPTRDAVLAVDLDGTVVAVNTFPFFVRYLARGLIRARQHGALARLVAVAVLRKLRLASHHDLKRVVCAVGSAVPSADTRLWAEALLAEHGHGEVLALIRGWDGPVVLTTAAPEVYAVHFGELLGIAEVHGSRLTSEGMTDNASHEKAVRLRTSGVDRVAVFVTDDLVLDAPMAALADLVLEVQRGGIMRECTAAGSDPSPS